MKTFWKGLAFAVALCLICSLSYASPRIKATYLFPYETTQVGDFIEPICEAEVIGESCLPGTQEEKTADVPYSGSVDYKGEVGYSGSKAYSVDTPFSGSIGYSGEVTATGEVAYEGTVPFTYTVYEVSETCFKANPIAPVCPEDRWTEYMPGKCPSKSEYPPFAVRCEEKKDWVWGFAGSYVYTHKFFLENRDGCCKENGGSENWLCFGVNPTLDGNPTDFCYDVYTPSEVTTDVPFSGSVPFSKTVGYKGSVDYSGSVKAEGTVDFAGSVDYSGTANYKGTTPFTYTSYGLPIYTPGTAVTNCENVGIEQLVTRLCPGESINVRGGGYIWREKANDVVKSRFVVFFQQPGKAKAVKIIQEDRDLADVQDGEFKEEREWTFELPGTYTIRYWVYNKGTPVSMAQTRVIEVLDGCQQPE